MMRKLHCYLWGICFLLFHFTANAQSTTVTGTVTAASDKSPLPGVSVVVKGTSRGTATGVDGTYTIAAAPTDVLVFRFLSMKTEERIVGDATVINIGLEADAKALDEVVVVGYGTQKRSDVTSAVTTVDTKVLDARPITDVARGLQGTTPGLSITTSSGAIGQNPNIRLRGNTGTLTGTGGAQPLILVDNVEIPDLQLVNPDDIESISVLKDASAASIYGTRGAWGVILITTKSGKKGSPTRVTYSNNLSWSSPTETPQIAPGAAGAEMAFRAYRRTNPSQTVFSVIGFSIDETAIGKMREWENLYGGQNLGNEMVYGRDFEYRDGRVFFYRSWDPGAMYMREWTPQQKHDISVTGGSEKTSFNLGVGFLGQEGVLKVNPDEFSRYNLNLGVNTEVASWLDARAKVLYSKTTLSEPFIFNSATYDPWYYLYRWPAVFPYGTYNGLPFRNSITEVEQAKMNQNTNGFTRISTGATFKPFEGLTVDADYTYSINNGLSHQTGGSISALDFWGGLNAAGEIPFRSYTNAIYNRAQYESSVRTLNTGKAFATYTKNLNDHSFKVIAGGDIESFDYIIHSSQRRNLIDPNLGEVNLATGDQFATSNHNRWNTFGVFGRINYSYKSKYLLELNSRYDGSSQLSPNEKWGLFPSMSAGYVVTEEPFMAFAEPVMSFLKLRASWGAIGNQNTSPGNIYSVLPTVNSGWLIGGQNMLTARMPQPISGNLTWETVTTLDFGADARFFRDKFGVVFDWYRRTTSDMHSAGEQVPATFGATAPRRNFGELQTTGWELAVDYNHSFNNGINFNATAILSDFQERLTKFEGARLITGNYEGRVLGEIWGYETDRFFTKDDFQQDANGNLITVNGRYVPVDGIPSQAQFEGNGFFYGPGDIKYKDLNGDGQIWRGDQTVENPGDMKVIGNSTPRYQYGLRLGADWKGFDLSVFIQGVGKRDFWAQGPMFIPGWRGNEAWYTHQLDYWTEENPNAFYPRPTVIGEASTRNFYPQTKYLLDLSYTRLKNLTFGYNLPKNLINKLKMERVRVYFSGENLFELDNLGDIPLDPEVNVTTAGANDPASFGRVYPYRRTLSFGLQVTL